MEKNKALHVKEVGTQGYVAVMRQDRRRYRDSFERGDARRSRCPGCFSFDDGDVGAVNVQSTSRIIRGNRAISKQIVL